MSAVRKLSLILAGVLWSLLFVSRIPAQDLEDVNPLSLSRDMKQFLDDKVDWGLPPLQRLHSLVEAVFESDNLHFSYAPVSHTAIETFRTQKGNCLSFTLLFISMARYLKLDAHFHEVEVPPVFTKSGSFIKVSQHLNSIVFIGGQTYVVDLFPEVVPIEVGGRIVSDQRGFAHFFNNKGVDELGKGNYALADVYLKKAIEIDPTAISPWINLGAARAQIGQFDQAEEYYHKALKLDRKNLAALSNLTTLFEKTGRKKEALRMQKKIREFRDKNPYYHFDLGKQAFERGDYAAALAHYAKAIKLKSKDHNFYFAVAQVYTKMGLEQRAMANMKLAAKYAADPGKRLLYAQKLEFIKSRLMIPDEGR